MRFIWFLLILGLMSGCKSKEQQSELPGLPEDFEVFYVKFHTDSAFQMEHIIFPLEGHVRLMENQIEIINPISWEKDDWTLHKPFNDHGGTFTQKYIMTDNVVIEKINDRSNFFRMERRFAKLGDEWSLIYYGANN
jgi:hypothetical protein